MKTLSAELYRFEGQSRVALSPTRPAALDRSGGDEAEGFPDADGGAVGDQRRRPAVVGADVLVAGPGAQGDNGGAAKPIPRPGIQPVMKKTAPMTDGAAELLFRIINGTSPG
ncbi:hypothetical protein [Streptomyces sp. NPDC004134]|uniref:hypothetical protein n=1 Tax=Streptomyces sp. NPDC004134 TaxID=3364691 RepID=UPI0036B690A8